MKKIFIIFSFLLFPAIAFAQILGGGSGSTYNQEGDLGGIILLFGRMVSWLIPIVSMLAILYFFYGLAKFILSSGDPKAADEGKGIMFWGVLALFIMTSISGILGLIQRSTGADMAGRRIDIEVPTFRVGL